MRWNNLQSFSISETICCMINTFSLIKNDWDFYASNLIALKKVTFSRFRSCDLSIKKNGHSLFINLLLNTFFFYVLFGHFRTILLFTLFKFLRKPKIEKSFPFFLLLSTNKFWTNTFSNSKWKFFYFFYLCCCCCEKITIH